MKAVLEHTNRITSLVHDQLIGWTGGLLKEAGLESVDVWGRFPPEGTVRSHLVLFPYRVGPEPKNLENARGASIMTKERFPSDRHSKVPKPWRDMGRQLYDAVNLLFPEAGRIRKTHRDVPSPLPFPQVDHLPKPLREWYRAQDPHADDPFVVEEDGVLYGRPPTVHWKPGVSVWAHYIAVAGDAGRGVSDRTSDAPPLSLAALSILTVGIQLERVLKVELPPMPIPDDLKDFLVATRESLEGLELDEDEDSDDDRPAVDIESLHADITASLEALQGTFTYEYGVFPVHDLSMHEFALLTQALQRPLQAVLNFRLNFQLGDIPEFRPGSVVTLPNARRRERR